MLLRKILATLAVAITAALFVPAAATAAPGRSGADQAAPRAEGATGADRTAAATAGAARATAAGADRASATAAPRAAASANPVIVVGGLSGFAAVYEPLAGRLRADGFRVWIYQLPNLGLGDIADSAQGLSGYVGQVRSATGAAKVDLVAHSQGGLASRYFLKNLGGTDSVGRYISLGTPEYGTHVANILNFLGLGSCAGIVACQQMSVGSAFLADLNGGDDTPGAVRYTTVRTLQDEVIHPISNSVLADGATNVLIQSWCPFRLVGHIALAFDGTTYTIIRGALADGPVRPNCFAL